jgi:Cu(I)/Ag(I) efflux system periplasmic protein CusF
MKTFLLPILTLAALATPGLPVIAHAQAQPAQTVQADAALTEGEVRRIDTAAQKITLRHGPIANIDMPAMTMVFQVRDPALLNNAKAGDKVRFSVEKINGVYTVIRLEAAR